MTRLIVVCGLLGGFGVASYPGVEAQEKKETVDERLRRLEKAKDVKIKVGESTTDACSKVNDVYILSTTDGKLTLKPGDSVYFQRTTKDPYEKTGGWYWDCGDSHEKSRIKVLNGYIRATRDGNTGKIDWHHVILE